MILQGDVLQQLKRLDDESVNCVVTSPPYWGLRDYGMEGQIGLEKSINEYVEKMVKVFSEIRRILTNDGTLWLNLGDSYAGSGKGPAGNLGKTHNERWLEKKHSAIVPDGLKPKDLVGIPWRVAFALQADGWYLRQDIIWAKPNPMPESVRDRCTKSHEYLFMLTKSGKYFYDNEAVKEPIAESSLKRIQQLTFDQQTGGEKDYGRSGVNTNRSARKALENFASRVKMPPIGGIKQTSNGNPTYSGNQPLFNLIRNRRSVWMIPTKPFKEAHFAVMPEALVEPCILAGCPSDGIVLDPFFGSGTVGVVAQKHFRKYIGIELNPEYVEIAKRRLGIS